MAGGRWGRLPIRSRGRCCRSGVGGVEAEGGVEAGGAAEKEGHNHRGDAQGAEHEFNGEGADLGGVGRIAEAGITVCPLPLRSMRQLLHA